MSKHTCNKHVAGLIHACVTPIWLLFAVPLFFLLLHILFITHTGLHAHIHSCIYTYTCAHGQMYTCMLMRTHTRMHMHAHTRT